MKTPTPTFTVRDFWLAATLVAMGMEVVSVEVHQRRPEERPGPPWATFVLTDRPDRRQLVLDYAEDRLCVNPRKLRDAFRRCQELRGAAPGSDRRWA